MSGGTGSLRMKSRRKHVVITYALIFVEREKLLMKLKEISELMTGS